MKNNLFATLCCAFLLTLGMTSCQNEESVTPTEKISYRAASWTHSPVTPCAGDDFTVTFNNGASNGNCGNTQIQRWNGTQWVQVAMATPVNGALSYTELDAAAGDYLYRAQWFRTGNPTTCPGSNTGWIEYTVTVENCCTGNTLTAEVTCDEDATCNRSVTFTFSGAYEGPIVVQGGLTRFTTICAASATGGLVRNTTHPGVVNSNANVTRWEGTYSGECGEVSVTIDWTSTNSAAEITGQWTVSDADGNVLAYVCPLNCAGESAETCE
jgi:hypothetical protein